MYSLSLTQIPLLSALLNPLLPHHNDNQQNQHQHQHQNQYQYNIQGDTCPNPPTLSCPSPPPSTINTCCVNHPSGHFLQTQFWDTSPPLGPADSFTIHGLWPDLCTGGFDAFCDNSRSQADVGAVLREMDPALTSELVEFMSKYWLSLNGDNAHLWTHEWNKHGTCISTLEPRCYSPASGSSSSLAESDGDVEDVNDLQTTGMQMSHADLLDYFVHTTSLFRTLDTHAILAARDILPSPSRRYTLAELEDAVQASAHGQRVTFRCNRAGELDEVWYHFSVMGSLRLPHGEEETIDAGRGPFLNASTVRETFIPAPPDGIISNCPRRGIKYLPKRGGDEPDPRPTRTVTHTSPPHASPTSTSPPFTGKGFLQVHVLEDEESTTSGSSVSAAGEAKGCLIRLGTWYTSGTCATFRAQPDVVDPGHAPLFSLASRANPCAVDPTTGKFQCTRSSAVQGIFSSDAHDPSVLAYQNRTTFYADRVPGRFDKVDIYANDGDGSRQVQLEIHWVAV